MSRRVLWVIRALTAGAATLAVLGSLPGARAATPNGHVYASPLQQANTASIAGVVVTTGEAPRPIRRAVVTATGRALAAPVSAITDDTGAFRLANLPAGRYELSVNKPAYVATAYGATRSGGTGTPIAVEAGDEITDITLPLPLGGVITGAIRDIGGAPVADVAVAALAVSGTTRAPAPAINAEVVTDDQGTYRIYGLAPGDYVVAVDPPGADRRIEATVTDVDAVFRRLEMGSSVTAAPGAADQAGPTVAFAPLFYPGTPTSADATRIRIVPGQVRDGIDITMDLVPSGAIEGRVARLDGGAIGDVSVSLASIGPLLPEVFVDWRFEGRPTPDDPAFRFSRVAPGRYVLSARATIESDAASPLPFWAMAEVAVMGSGATSVDLSLRPAVSLSGTVTFRGTPGSDAEPSAAYVGLERRDVSDVGQVPSPFAHVPLPRPATAEDGAFVIGGVFPGTFSLRAVAPGWRLDAVKLGERDLLDLPLVIDAGSTDVEGIEVVFSNRPRELTGVLQTPAGARASSFFVLVFPVDRTMWRPGARRVRVTRPDTEGRYVFDGLPAGDYLLAALTEFDDAALDDAGFLGQVAPLALPVTVTELPRTTQDIAIGGGVN